MESLSGTTSMLIATLAVGLISLLTVAWKMRNHPNAKTKDGLLKPPEPKGAWPIVGHLCLLFDKSTPIYRTLAAVADKHGSIFLVRLGIRPHLVVSNWEAVKECFTTNDLIFSYRPKSIAGKYMGYNYAASGFAPYGPHWREVRKLVVSELLSSRLLPLFARVRSSEVHMMMKELYCLVSAQGNHCTRNQEPGRSRNDIVTMSEVFDKVAINFTSRILGGKRYFGGSSSSSKVLDDAGLVEAEKYRRVVKELLRALVGSFLLSDLFPIPMIISWLDPGGHISSLKRIIGELDSMVRSWIDEHRRTRKVAVNMSGYVEEDLIDVMLSLDEKDTYKWSDHSYDTVMTATTMEVWLSSESSSITMTWILSSLLNHPGVLKHAQEELEQIVGRNRWVKEDDIGKLVYLQAVVKEIFRLYPPGPLLTPREASKDCLVSGYHIEKGTRLFVNAWKLHRDPRIWTEPNEFIPERFLTNNVSINIDTSGQHFKLIPFGCGRRICPGSASALQLIHLTIASLLQGFNLSTPMGEPVDMSEGIGLNLPKALPLNILLTPRLPEELYA